MDRQAHLQGILHISQKPHLLGSPVKEPSLKVPPPHTTFPSDGKGPPWRKMPASGDFPNTSSRVSSEGTPAEAPSCTILNKTFSEDNLCMCFLAKHQAKKPYTECFLIRRQAIKPNTEVQVHLHKLLTSTLNREWSTSNYSCIIPRKRVSETHWIEGLIGHSTSLDILEKRKISCTCWEPPQFPFQVASTV